MRKTGPLIIIIAIIALAWLVRSFNSEAPVPPMVIILILGFLLAALLLRKTKPKPDRNSEIAPSQRRQRKTDKHKSWISRNDRQ